MSNITNYTSKTTSLNNILNSLLPPDKNSQNTVINNEPKNPTTKSRKSILSSKLIFPKFDPHKNWYRKKLQEFYTNENISNIFIHNKKCGHFYRVKNDSNFYNFKKGNTKYYKKERCLVCDKLKVIPDIVIRREVECDDTYIVTYKTVAEALVKEYSKFFKKKIPYEDYYFKLFDCEKCYYIWLYKDEYNTD